jgi:hypothetical protein
MRFSSFSALRDSGFFLVSAHIRLNDTSLKFVSCLGDETHTQILIIKNIYLDHLHAVMKVVLICIDMY